MYIYTHHFTFNVAECNIHDVFLQTFKIKFSCNSVYIDSSCSEKLLLKSDLIYVDLAGKSLICMQKSADLGTYFTSWTNRHDPKEIMKLFLCLSLSKWNMNMLECAWHETTCSMQFLFWHI